MPTQSQLHSPVPHRVVVAITGASGAIIGMRLLQILGELPNIERHLVVSTSGYLTLKHETGLSRKDIEHFAEVHHDVRNIGACIASGSFQASGMVIAPCSMRSLAAIANGLSDNLVTRAADVMLKERRRLVLCVRETPFNLAHLRNMTAVTEMGGIIAPPLPAFYQMPQTIDDIVVDIANRLCELLGYTPGNSKRWQGLNAHLNGS